MVVLMLIAEWPPSLYCKSSNRVIHDLPLASTPFIRLVYKAHGFIQ